MLRNLFNITSKKNKVLYLDFAAATPMDKDVAELVSRTEQSLFANASSIHSLGVETERAIESARERISSLINAHADEMIFTGSGTESNALAVLGVVNSYYETIENRKGTQKHENEKVTVPHIITSAIEHPAVLENCNMLERSGRVEVTYIGVNENGIVDPKEIQKALKANTVLVSIMYANNEIGTIQPIQEIAKVIRSFKKERTKSWKESGPEVHGYFSGEKFLVLEPSLSQGTSFPDSFRDLYPVLHTDACQAMNYLFTENIEKLGVDLMSWNSSKVYGPKGVGVLFKKRGVALAPIYSGGGQEGGLRSGTENVAGIVGTALALEKTIQMKTTETARLTQIRDYGIGKLLALSDDADLNNENLHSKNRDNNKNFKIVLNGDKVHRLPNNINISVSGISSELLVIELSAKGIMVSAKSACKSDDPDESYVIAALRKAQEITSPQPSPYQGEGERDATVGSLRISLGRTTTQGDMDYLVKSLKAILTKYKPYK
jgi:cysteine desulfurase